MKGSTGGGSLSQSGKVKVKVRVCTTGLVSPAASILSRIFCFDFACRTRLAYVPARCNRTLVTYNYKLDFDF